MLSSMCFIIARGRDVYFLSQNPCSPLGSGVFQFIIFQRCSETCAFVIVISFFCITCSNSFSTVTIYFAFLLWSIGSSHHSFQNFSDPSSPGIARSCLIFRLNSSCKAFQLFLKFWFCQYCFSLDLLHYSFNVITVMCCLCNNLHDST